MIQKIISLNPKDAKGIIFLKNVVGINKNKKLILIKKNESPLINYFILLILLIKNQGIESKDI